MQTNGHRSGAHRLGLVLALTGCLQTTRTRELLAAHYRDTPVPGMDRARLIESLGVLSTSGPCSSLSAPCRVVPLPLTAPKDADLCLRWGRAVECFALVDTEPGPAVLVRALDAPPGSIAAWLFERVDADFTRIEAAAHEDAVLEATAGERASLGPASSLWANARLLFAAPRVEASAHLQGGYRHWLTSSVLVSAGAGYEAALVPAAGGALLRDAFLLTARIEFSSARFKSSFLNVPWLSAYFGATGVFTLGGGTGLRGFVGVSSLIPVNVELGVSVLRLPNALAVPTFVVAAGLGL